MEQDELERLDVGPMATLAGYQLRRAQLLLFQDFSDVCGVPDLTPALFHVLVLVASNPQVTPSAIATELGADRSSVAPLVNKLERLNWIERQRGRTDRRMAMLAITSAGRLVLETAIPRLIQHEHRLLRRLTPGQRQGLISALQSIGS